MVYSLNCIHCSNHILVVICRCKRNCGYSICGLRCGAPCSSSSPATTCNLPKNAKRDCGTVSTTKTECIVKGCCWGDYDGDPSVPSCYYPANPQPPAPQPHPGIPICKGTGTCGGPKVGQAAMCTDSTGKTVNKTCYNTIQAAQTCKEGVLKQVDIFVSFREHHLELPQDLHPDLDQLQDLLRHLRLRGRLFILPLYHSTLKIRFLSQIEIILKSSTKCCMKSGFSMNSAFCVSRLIISLGIDKFSKYEIVNRYDNADS